MHNGFLISVSKASILIQELLCPINLLLTLNTSSPLPVFGYHFQLSDAVRRNTLQETEVQRHPRDRTESAKCQACPRENEAMHCGVVSRKKCKKLLTFLQFFHLQDVSSEQSYHCITAQMKIQEQLLDSHTGSQLLHQHKTARGFSLNQRDAGTAPLKPHFCSQNIHISFRTLTISVNSNFQNSWRYTTSDLQGISAKIRGILICKVNF